MTSFDWGHYSPGGDDAFPTPFIMEPIVVIAFFPFVTAAFVLFFVIALGATADFAFAFGLTFASPKPSATLASPLTITSIFPSALISRGATPPIKLITEPKHNCCLCQACKNGIVSAFHHNLSFIDPSGEQAGKYQILGGFFFRQVMVKAMRFRVSDALKRTFKY